MDESTVVSQLGDQVTGLITKKAVIRAKNMIQKYNGETDAILLSEGLTQVREMLLTMMNMNLKMETTEFYLIGNAFLTRWLKIDRLLRKTRGKRPTPILTTENREKYAEISALAKMVFGNTLPVGNVIPLLLEVNDE